MRVFFWAIVATFSASVASAATVYEYQGRFFRDGSAPIRLRLVLDENYIGLGNGYSYNQEQGVLDIQANYEGDDYYGSLISANDTYRIDLTFNQWGNIRTWYILGDHFGPAQWVVSNLGDALCRDTAGPDGECTVAPRGAWSTPMPTPLPASALLLATAASALAFLRRRRKQ